MSRIMIAVPTTGSVHYKTAAALTHIAARRKTAIVYGCHRPHDAARNWLVRIFLQQPPEFTHLLFIDSDVEPPLDVIDRLLDCDRPVVTGCIRIINPAGPVWTIANRNADGKHPLLADLPDTVPFDVDVCGAGCLLIARDVLDTMPRPWFRWLEDDNGGQTGEDIYFCKKLNAAGWRVRVDPSVRCTHHKTIGI